MVPPVPGYAIEAGGSAYYFLDFLASVVSVPPCSDGTRSEKQHGPKLKAKGW